MKFLITAASALAISALPLKLDLGSAGIAKMEAYAKSDKGGGGGSDRGGGNDRGGNDKGGGSDHGKSGGSSNGKSAAASKSKSGGGTQTASAGGLLQSLFGGGKSKKTVAHDTKRAAPRNAKATHKSKAPQVLTASAVVPSLKPAKQKNLNARLAGLNSLKRNYHAYLNSQSPRMALVREYVLNSAKLDLAVEDVELASDKVAKQQAAFDAAVAAIEPYDGSPPIADPTEGALQARLDELNSLQPPADPAEFAAFEAEKAALSDALAASDDLAAAEEDLVDAQAAAAAAGEGTTEEDLREALLAAANPNRVAEYGDAYLDDGVLDWAKDVLGVGDAYGKIDQVREVLATEPASETEVEPAPVIEPESDTPPTLVLAPAN